MSHIVDTSAFLVGQHKQLHEYYTTYSVIDELDKLKDNPRTSHRQREAMHDIMKDIAANKLHVIDLNDYADDDLLQQAGKDKELLTCDVQLYVKQKVKGYKASLIHEKLPDYVLHPIPTFITSEISGDVIDTKLDLPENKYVLVTNGIGTRIGFYSEESIRFINDDQLKNQYAQQLNLEQKILMHQIYNKNIQLVTQIGQAGSGKTFISLQQQMQMITCGEYEKIIVQVPPVQLSGLDRYGFLPGTLEEKASQQLSGIRDNLIQLFDDEGKKMFNEQIDKKSQWIEIQQFQNIRGRSIKNSIVIIDEQQNTSVLELKTFLTRIDNGSKIILLGDIDQIDIKLRSVENNGLIQVCNKFYKTDVHQHIVLNKTYRSKLAKYQVELL